VRIAQPGRRVNSARNLLNKGSRPGKASV
jgi:hypothetical protein